MLVARRLCHMHLGRARKFAAGSWYNPGHQPASGTEAANFPSSSPSNLPMSPCIRGGRRFLARSHFPDKIIGSLGWKLEAKIGGYVYFTDTQHPPLRHGRPGRGAPARGGCLWHAACAMATLRKPGQQARGMTQGISRPSGTPAENFPSSSPSNLPMSPCIRGGRGVLGGTHFPNKIIGSLGWKLEAKIGGFVCFAPHRSLKSEGFQPWVRTSRPTQR
jgi:hypothetical protein